MGTTCISTEVREILIVQCPVTPKHAGASGSKINNDGVSTFKRACSERGSIPFHGPRSTKCFSFETMKVCYSQKSRYNQLRSGDVHGKIAASQGCGFVAGGEGLVCKTSHASTMHGCRSIKIFLRSPRTRS